MKHLAKKCIATILLLALFVPLLASCSADSLPFALLGKERRAIRLLKTDVNQSEGVQSYRVKGELKMSGTEGGERWDISTTELLTVTGLEAPDSLFYYQKATSLYSYANVIAPEETYVLESGFTGGQMFTRRAVGAGEPVTLVSPLTGPEYLAHLRETGNGALAAIAESEADRITCEKNDAGEWIATFTDFSALGLKQLCNHFEAADQLLYATIENATLSFRTTEDFRPLELKLEVRFADSRNVDAALSYTRAYEEYNNATAPALDISDCQETKDLRLAEAAAALFREIECASSLSFTKTEKYFLKPDTESGKKNQLERHDYEVSQTESENGYTFNATITSGEDVTTYKYANGKFRTEDKAGQNPAKTMTDAAARAKVYDWFDTAFFDECDLTTSELVDGQSRFKFKSVDIDAYASRLEAVGSGVDKIRRTSSMLDVEVKDGKMVSYSYMATIWIYRRGSAYVYYYEVTVDNISYELTK